MDYVERVWDAAHGVFLLNPATLSGAIDILVVEQPDGTLKSVILKTSETLIFSSPIVFFQIDSISCQIW